MSTAQRGRPGKDPRIVAFRGALEALLESLDALIRISRWQQEGEPIPDPLQNSESQLLDRLGSANRLASGRFVGAPAVVASSDAIRSAIQELDAAYVAYRKQIDSTLTDKVEAVIALDAEVGRVKMDAPRWE